VLALRLQLLPETDKFIAVTFYRTGLCFAWAHQSRKHHHSGASAADQSNAHFLAVSGPEKYSDTFDRVPFEKAFMHLKIRSSSGTAKGKKLIKLCMS
jgi:hypothetical protein